MRVAVIGTGFGEKVAAPVYRRLGFDVDVVSPRSDDAVKRACAEQVDLVSIHSPPFLHHQHVQWALDNGRAVLCDKPFGRNATEARAMRDRAQELGVLNFLNFEFRRQPSRVKLRQLIKDGAIGDLVHISWTMFGSARRHQKHHWLHDRSMGGGWLGGFGSHAIDAIRWLFESEIVDCGGISRTEVSMLPDQQGVLRRATAEDAFSAWFRSADGKTAMLDTAFGAPVFLTQHMLLTGGEGALDVIDDYAIVLHRPGHDQERFEFSPPTGDPHEPGLVPWLTEVTQALRTGRQITPSFADGAAVAEVMDQLRAKARAVEESAR